MLASWRLLLNIALFQLGWFACLLLSSSWLLAVIVLVLAIHFYYIVPKEKCRSEMQLIALVVCVGFFLECGYLFFRVIIREDGELFPPIWLLFIWLLFATTFRYSLAWLRPKPILSALFAGVAAPMSYLAGVNLNDTVTLNSETFFSLAVISASWAIIFPFLMKYSVNDNRR